MNGGTANSKYAVNSSRDTGYNRGHAAHKRRCIINVALAVGKYAPTANYVVPDDVTIISPRHAVRGELLTAIAQTSSHNNDIRADHMAGMYIHRPSTFLDAYCVFIVRVCALSTYIVGETRQLPTVLRAISAKYGEPILLRLYLDPKYKIGGLIRSTDAIVSIAGSVCITVASIDHVLRQLGA